MERRILFAVLLSFLVLYLYQGFLVRPAPRPVAGKAAAPGPTAPEATAAGAPQASPTAPVQAQPVAPAARTLTGDTAERSVTVETRDVIAVFTNRGALLQSWRLKHYLDRQGRPQELIARRLSTQPLPFTLRTPDERVNSAVNGALYTVSGAPTGPATSAGTDLRFEYEDANGLRAVKRFHLDPASYVVSFSAEVRAGDRALPAAMLWGPAVGDTGELVRGTQPAQGLAFENGRVSRLTASDIGKQGLREGDFRYAGVDDNYFMAVALAPGPSNVTYQLVRIPPPANTKEPERALVAFAIELQQPASPLKVFVGPKDFDLLASIDQDLARAVNFGRFAFIVVPLLRSLKWVNRYIGNWGWSIVILTIIINGIMAPLRHKQVMSMRKMQAIQPEVKAIQDRYAKLKATDPAKQKMNQEMMALYREKKVNPASGCVPMLLTFPLVFAMWALLQTSIELRGAPWFGWIRDLSAYDPWYVLPGLMIATSFWQQRMTPAAGADPAQQKMMMFMPLVMGFIFLFLPSGALLYYVVGNLFGIGQQYLTNYLIGPPPTHAVRPPAERRAKRVGSGRTEAADAKAKS